MSESTTSESFAGHPDPSAELGPDEASGVADGLMMNISIDAVFDTTKKHHQITICGEPGNQSFLFIGLRPTADPSVCKCEIYIDHTETVRKNLASSTSKPPEFVIQWTELDESYLDIHALARPQPYKHIVLVNTHPRAEHDILAVAEVRIA